MKIAVPYKNLDAANKKQIKVAFHIELFVSSGPAVVSEIYIIYEKYGARSAYFRDPSHGNRTAFYIFQSSHITDWSAIESLKSKNIVSAQNVSPTEALAQHFSGFYFYTISDKTANDSMRETMDFCNKNNLTL